MNGLQSRSRGAATSAERAYDERRASRGEFRESSRERQRDGRDRHDGRANESATGGARRRGHEPVSGEIDVDGAPMAVDRCRFCNQVLLDRGRTGGPCSGPNRTLTEFGISPPADRDRDANPPAGRLARADRRREAKRSDETERDDNEGRKERPPTLAPR